MKKVRSTALFMLIVIMLSVFAPASVAEEKHTVVIASSDFQADTDELSQAQLARIFEAIKRDGYTHADGYLHCGDYTVKLHYSIPESESGIQALLETINEADFGIPEYEIILTQGNHDPEGTRGLSHSGDNDPDSEEYGVFVINEDDYMWFAGNQGNNGTWDVSRHEDTVESTAIKLENYLKKKAEKRFQKPIFVISHLPLHYSMRTMVYGDCRYAKYIVDALNYGASLGLNIVFMFGHNHSQGWDNYMGAACVYLEKGSVMNVSDISNPNRCYQTQIGFTYLNAGYTGYYHTDFGEPVDDTLTITVYDFTDDQLVIKRYSEDGLHDLKAVGVANRKSFSGRTEANTGVYTPVETRYDATQTIDLITEYQPAVGASCDSEGSVRYYYSAARNEYYSDRYLLNKLDPATLSIPKTPHSFENGVCGVCGKALEHVPLKPADCDTDGNVEYYFDAESGKYYSDGAAKNEINLQSTVIHSTGHRLDDSGKCVICGRQIEAPRTAAPTTVPATKAPTTAKATKTPATTAAPTTAAPTTADPTTTSAPETSAAASTASESTVPATEPAETSSSVPETSAPIETTAAAPGTSADAAPSSEIAKTQKPAEDGPNIVLISAVGAAGVALIAVGTILIVKKKKS